MFKNCLLIQHTKISHIKVCEFNINTIYEMYLKSNMLVIKNIKEIKVHKI